MKKKMDMPFIKVMKLDAMDVIATSSTQPKEDGLTIQSLTTAEDGNSIGF